MEVILCHDVESKGRVGDVVKVKEGYARNYLFPNRLAMPASKANLKKIEQARLKREEEYQKEKQSATQRAEELNKISCTVSVEVNEQEKLYGSVTEAEIVSALEAEGQSVNKKDIILDKPIDELGIFDVGIKLHPEVVAKIRLWVAKK